MINIAVEGESDRKAATAVVECAGRTVGRLYVAGGKSKLDPKIPKYSAAARETPWVVFRDSDGQCPVRLREDLLQKVGGHNSRFLVRIAHSMTEAWLLADVTGFSTFFRVNPAKIPRDPEALRHAKQSLLALCADSSSRAIRQGMTTADGKTGPLYVVHLNEFASSRWDVEAAAENSPSLARALTAIRALPS